MALLRKKEFAELCGIKDTSIPTYVKRKKIVPDKNGLIDTEHQANKVFYQKMSAKKMTDVEEQEIIKLVKKAGGPAKYMKISELAPDNDEPEEFGEDGEAIPALHLSEKKLKYLDTLKREKEVELLKLREEKLKGAVVPSELIKPLFLQHNQSLMVEFKNAAEDIIRRIGRQKDIPHDEVAKLKGELVKVINESIEKATKATVMSVDSVIKDYSQQRAVGERKGV